MKHYIPEVTITLSSVQAMVKLMRILNWTREVEKVVDAHYRTDWLFDEQARVEFSVMRETLRAALMTNGIDYQTYQPDKPIEVAGYVLGFKQGGEIVAGCTTISKERVEEIIANWKETLPSAEPK